MYKILNLIYAVLFAIGLKAGWTAHAHDNGHVPMHVAGSNAYPIHVVLALCIVIGSIVGYLRNKRRVTPTEAKDNAPQGVKGFWLAPFTDYGLRRIVFAATALPFAALELACSFLFLRSIVNSLEKLQLRIVGSTAKRQDRGYGPSLAHFSAGMFIGLIQMVLVYFVLYTFWRAGQQLFGALSPSFVVNAWGGPTYLGASLAHWMDGILILIAAFLSIKYITRFQVQRATVA